MRAEPLWGVRRHDVGPEPVIQTMEGRDAQAEQMARSMAKDMTEVARRNGWDNAPELVRCQLMWEVVPIDKPIESP